MQFNLERLDKNLVALDVTIEPDEIEEALSEAYKKVVHKINLPGFRKGHIPRHVLEAQFGKEVLYEDALDIMVPKAYLEALDKYQLEPIAQPKLDIKDPLDSEKPFAFKATVEILPEVELGNYKGLEVEKAQVNVSQEQVDERLKGLRERHAELVLSEKQELANGDFGVIDFEGYLNGKPFQGGAAQAYTLEIGSGSFIPGFEEQLIGLKVGEESEVKVTFPADYPNAELAGQEALFKVALKEIKVKELPVLDDEFAKSLGKFETLEELKTDLREKIALMAEREVEYNYTQAAVAQAVDNSKVEVPETLTTEESNELLHSFEHNLAHQGLAFDKYLEFAKKTKEEVLQDFRPEAERRVKTNLVLGAVAKQEELTVSEPELEERLTELARHYQEKDTQKLRRELEKHGRLNEIKQAILIEKATQLIKENAVPKLVEKK